MSDFYKFFIIPMFIDAVILAIMYTRRKNRTEDENQQQGGCASAVALTIVIILAMMAVDTLLSYIK